VNVLYASEKVYLGKKEKFWGRSQPTVKALGTGKVLYIDASYAKYPSVKIVLVLIDSTAQNGRLDFMGYFRGMPSLIPR
jgi:hypothetical protein